MRQRRCPKQKGGKLERTCVGCGRVRRREELIRIARQKSGEVVIDLNQRLGGRGAYLCPNSECLRLAEKRGRLVRALRAPKALSH